MIRALTLLVLAAALRRIVDAMSELHEQRCVDDEEQEPMVIVVESDVRRVELPN